MQKKKKKKKKKKKSKPHFHQQVDLMDLFSHQNDFSISIININY